MRKGVTAVMFAPTGTPQKIVRAFGRGFLSGCDVEALREYDLTRPEGREKLLPRMEKGLFGLGFPVYEERIPHHIRKKVESLSGLNTPKVIIAVYGGMGGRYQPDTGPKLARSGILRTVMQRLHRRKIR